MRTITLEKQGKKYIQINDSEDIKVWLEYQNLKYQRISEEYEAFKKSYEESCRAYKEKMESYK
jgi:hypothetical protein